MPANGRRDLIRRLKVKTDVMYFVTNSFVVIYGGLHLVKFIKEENTSLTKTVRVRRKFMHHSSSCSSTPYEGE